MRKLASIQKILSLDSIEGADAIMKATVLGWQVVVKKDEFKVGDLIVYCEIDSIMPDKPEFEFLKSRGMRIKTVKLRGQVSQGICFPISILPSDFIIEEGEDCTEALGVMKYEPIVPASLSGVAKGGFPSFIPKTDETRVQVLQGLLNEYKGKNYFYVTEKLDGSSITVYLNNGEFGVCSRNLDLEKDEGSSFWSAVIELGIEDKLRQLGRNIALQGELVGSGIQGNKLKLIGRKVYFFNAFDIDNYKYLGYDDFMTLINDLGVESVPVIQTNYELSDDIQSIVKFATRKSVLSNSDVWAEGIVIRNMRDDDILPLPRNFQKYGNINRLSFKAINPEFLLKYGE